jgi:biotin carboxyl carrier protein
MKKYLITVKGVSYEVEVEEIKDGVTYKAESTVSKPMSEPKPAEQKPTVVKKPEQANSNSKDSISSPMPGTILKVKVKSGDSVKKGDVLVILEAMKMENEILAPDDKVIASVAVTEGATVSTGDIMVTFK